MSGRIVVNDHSSGWLRKGFAWVYPKEVVSGRPRPGQVCSIADRHGRVLGVGIGDSGRLAMRVMRHDEGRLDAAWVDRVMTRAQALRLRVVEPDTTGYRLVNAENDDLPGIRVDWWDHFAVIALDSPALGGMVPLVADWLEANLSPRGIYLCYRKDRRDTRNWERVQPEPGLVRGRAPTGPVTVKERGLSFLVHPSEGPDVGLYSDMRGVRAFLEPHWGGTEVLNTFAYTGAFSVSAAMNGAASVDTVDLSARYLERAEANFVANGLDPDLHQFREQDTFKALDHDRRTGRTYDRVVLDPPSFSHSSAGTWSAKKDMPRLVAASARILAPQGWLIAASNQGDLSPRQFSGMVQDGIRRAKRQAKLLWFGGQGPDFPAALHFPEGRYLKVGIYEMD